MKILTIPEFGFGDYNYYVQTPENETLYFRTKSEAKSFIEFYKTYTTKMIERKNGTDLRTKNES
jgi:hypothetical protein